MSRVRIAVGALTLSAAGFVGIVMNEGYSDTAIIPVKDDRPTIGFGSTFNEDGTPVKMGDRTTPVRALIKAQAHINKEEQAFQRSLAGGYLSQAEYDLYMDWVYQYGIGNWLKSTMRREILAGRYVASCDALLAYKFSQGRDCSKAENWGPKGCKGVWTRQLERHAKCMAAQ